MVNTVFEYVSRCLHRPQFPQPMNACSLFNVYSDERIIATSISLCLNMFQCSEMPRWNNKNFKRRTIKIWMMTNMSSSMLRVSHPLGTQLVSIVWKRRVGKRIGTSREDNFSFPSPRKQFVKWQIKRSNFEFIIMRQAICFDFYPQGTLWIFFPITSKYACSFHFWGDILMHSIFLYVHQIALFRLTTKNHEQRIDAHYILSFDETYPAIRIYTKI